MVRIRHLCYNLLLCLLAPLIIAFTALQAHRRSGGLAFFLQRIGTHRAIGAVAGEPLWVHAASIGEVKAVLPLIERLLEQPSLSHCLLTTNTPEAARLIKQRAHPGIHLRYCPIDWPLLTERFVRAIRPAALLMVETEIWPNLYRAAHRQSVPLVIVNARLSPRTMDQPKIVRLLLADALAHVSLILARSSADVQHFENLHASRQKMRLCGNIKLAAGHRQARAEPLAALQNRDYVLAVSTHAPEERILATALAELADDTLLVIVPRHPQRSTEIETMLSAMSVAVAVRSRGETPISGKSIYLADTVGEVDALISAAQFVYVGGSLAPIGGHNLLEPASRCKPVLSGPQLHNFREEAQLLESFDALLLVRDEAQLTARFVELQNSASLRQRFGDASRRAIASCHSTLDRYVSEIVPILERAAKS